MENRFSDVMYFSHVVLCDFFNPWMLLYCEFCPETPQHRLAVSISKCFKSLWCSIREIMTKRPMYGSEPYQFKRTYPPEEEPVLHGEEERSSSPEPESHLPKSNLDLLWNLLVSVCCSFSNIFYNKKPLTSFLIGTWPLSIRVQTQEAGVSCHTTPVRSLTNLGLL